MSRFSSMTFCSSRVWGVICNTAIIVTCLCNGINQAAQPILSTNYGAGLTERIGQVRKLGIKTALCICSIPAIMGLIIPDLFTYIFLNPSEEILAMSQTAIRIYFLGFFVMGINMFVVGYFSIYSQTIFIPHCLPCKRMCAQYSCCNHSCTTFQDRRYLGIRSIGRIYYTIYCTLLYEEIYKGGARMIALSLTEVKECMSKLL